MLTALIYPLFFMFIQETPQAVVAVPTQPPLQPFSQNPQPGTLSASTVGVSNPTQPSIKATAPATLSTSLFNFGSKTGDTPLGKASSLAQQPSATKPLTFSFLPKPPVELAAKSSSASPRKADGDGGAVAAPDHEDDVERPEAFVPTVDFAPCVEKLPELVKATTGEEGESQLFCQRARLFRWDKEAEGGEGAGGEWKARGVGELKILADEASRKYRIVMRRDQIMKICANHYVMPGINMKRHPQRAVACMWSARDFAVMDADIANPEGNDEVFMAQFKTEETATEFYDTVMACLEKVDTTTTADPQLKPKPTTQKVTETPQVPPKSSGLNKLKPKQGSWKCETCALNVPPESDQCLACQTPKPGTTATFKQQPTVKFSTPSTGGFVFGGPSASVDATSAEPPKFSFGTPKSTAAVAATVAPAPKFSFGMPQNSGEKSSPPTFSFGSPAVAPSTSGGPFAALDLTVALPKVEEHNPKSGGFTFSLQPPAAAAAPPSTTPVKKGVTEEEDEVAPCDQSQLNFTPILDHLPEKVETRTGEEDEEVAFEARAKLFRFDNGAWKERGLGQLKLLRSPETNRVRVVMRREQVHKVCCNHLITDAMELKPLGGASGGAVKPWVWWAVDFSEMEEVGPEGRKEMFSVRFKTQEESDAFYVAFMAAAKGSATAATASKTAAALPIDLHADEDELAIVGESSVNTFAFKTCFLNIYLFRGNQCSNCNPSVE